MTLTWAQAVIEALAWTLLHFLWQGSLLGLAHWLALRNLRSATARYVVSLIALGCVLLTPVATFLHLHESPAAPVVASGVAPVMLEALPVTGNPPVSVAPGDHLELLPPLVVGIWLIGVLLLALRFMGGLLHVRRLTRGARFDLVPEHVLRELESLRERLGVRVPVRLAVTALPVSPMVLGWWRPLLLLPMTAVTRLSHDQLVMVLAHELSHVRRHDALVNLVQVIVETLLFYHPAAHSISRSLRMEREKCCDDIAVALAGDRFAYARTLADLEEIRQTSIAPAMGMGMVNYQLYARVERLVREPGRDGREWWPVFLIIAAGLAVNHGPDWPLPGPEANGIATLRLSLPPAPAPTTIRPIRTPAAETETLAGVDRQASIETRERPAREAERASTPQVTRPQESGVNMQAAPAERRTAEPVAMQVKDEPAQSLETRPSTAKEPREPVISGGRLLHMEEPQYPRRALRNRIEGRVLLSFTIDTEGRVRDAVVEEASPRGMFERPALAAIDKWRYEPFLQDGVATERRVVQEIRFTLSDDPDGERDPCLQATGTRICR